MATTLQGMRLGYDMLSH